MSKNNTKSSGTGPAAAAAKHTAPIIRGCETTTKSCPEEFTDEQRELVAEIPLGKYIKAMADENNTTISEENKALGFTSNAQSEEHSKWLDEHGSPEYKTWVKSIREAKLPPGMPSQF